MVSRIIAQMTGVKKIHLISASSLGILCWRECSLTEKPEKKKKTDLRVCLFVQVSPLIYSCNNVAMTSLGKYNCRICSSILSRNLKHNLFNTSISDLRHFKSVWFWSYLNRCNNSTWSTFKLLQSCVFIFTENKSCKRHQYTVVK